MYSTNFSAIMALKVRLMKIRKKQVELDSWMRTVDPMDTSPSLLLRNCLSNKILIFLRKITPHILTLHIQHRLHGATRLCNISTDDKGEAIGARDTNPVILRRLLARCSLYRNQCQKVHTSVFSDCIIGEKKLLLMPSNCGIYSQTSKKAYPLTKWYVFWKSMPL